MSGGGGQRGGGDIGQRAWWRFGLAATIFALAGWLAFGPAPDRLDKPQATQLAGRLLGAYATQSGEPAVHFVRAGVVDWPDGWEFSWTYAPCPEIARLRIFVGRNGRADYAETPDCAPATGFAAPPAVV